MPERASCLLDRLMLLFREHLVFCPFRAFSLLPPDLGYPFCLSALFTLNSTLYLFIEQNPGIITVHPLRTGLLTFDLGAGRQVSELDTSLDLVDMLAALSSGTDKGLLDLLFKYPEVFEFFFEGLLFFRAYREHFNNYTLNYGG